MGVGGAASDFWSDGDRLCLDMYDCEDDLGGCGRPVSGDRGSSLYDDDLLNAGLADLDDAGDCAAGGV